VIRELVDKAPRVAPDAEWQVQPAFLARAGLNDAARREAESIGATPIDLNRPEADWLSAAWLAPAWGRAGCVLRGV
jgi:hypothetical protein